MGGALPIVDRRPRLLHDDKFDWVAKILFYRTAYSSPFREK